MTRVELLTVGDELLSGLVLNSNVARVADALGSLGLGLSMVCDVADDLDEIVAALRAATARADVVLCSGGLGPTSDDLTRDALAAAAGVDLVRDPTLIDVIRSRYAQWNVVPTDAALRQADVPVGAEVVPNPQGSAPGLRMELDGAVVIALPGVPRELVAMLDEKVVPYLAKTVATQRRETRTVRVALAGESTIAAALADLEALGAVRFAYVAAPGDVAVRLTGDPELVAEATEQVVAQLGDVAYSTDGRKMPEVLRDLLLAEGGTVAVAESVTGGMVGAALTDPSGASATFLGGALVYATEAKAELGVPADLLAERGPVDPDVAAALAARVRARLGARYGLATTGVAGPDAVGDLPAGTVYVAVDSDKGCVVARLALPPSRDLVRELSVVHVLDLFRRHLLDLPLLDAPASRPVRATRN
jgi:nicotinamide-nucleotide amidase